MSWLAVALYAFGVLLLFQTRLGWIAESILAAIYCAVTVREWRRFKCRLSGVDRLRIHADGSIDIRRRGEWIAGRLAAGSLLLGSTVWLRVTGEGGSTRIDCLCRQNSSGQLAWRRFLVIYRHIGGTN